VELINSQFLSADELQIRDDLVTILVHHASWTLLPILVGRNPTHMIPKFSGRSRPCGRELPKPIKHSPIEFFFHNETFMNSFIRPHSTNLLHFSLQLFVKSLNLNSDFKNMSNTSSSQEKILLVFEPSSLVSEPLSVSKDLTTSSKSSKEVLPRTVSFIDFLMIQDLEVPCESTRNRLETSSLRTLASEKNPDRATSGFIADAIGNNSDKCLWLNTNFALEGHNTPKGLFIHLFTNTTAEIVLSHEVHAMIIQVSEPLDSYLNINKFIEILFSKVSFVKLKCLMLYGFQFSENLLRCIGGLNLEAFHMAMFSYNVEFLHVTKYFSHTGDLRRLYMVHPDDTPVGVTNPLLEKLVIYCPESNRSITNETKDRRAGELRISLGGCNSIDEM
jgi:hypothetical protein